MSFKGFCHMNKVTEQRKANLPELSLRLNDVISHEPQRRFSAIQDGHRGAKTIFSIVGLFLVHSKVTLSYRNTNFAAAQLTVLHLLQCLDLTQRSPCAHCSAC